MKLKACLLNCSGLYVHSHHSSLKLKKKMHYIQIQTPVLERTKYKTCNFATSKRKKNTFFSCVLKIEFIYLILNMFT